MRGGGRCPRTSGPGGGAARPAALGPRGPTEHRAPLLHRPVLGRGGARGREGPDGLVVVFELAPAIRITRDRGDRQGALGRDEVLAAARLSPGSEFWPGPPGRGPDRAARRLRPAGLELRGGHRHGASPPADEVVVGWTSGRGEPTRVSVAPLRGAARAPHRAARRRLRPARRGHPRPHPARPRRRGGAHALSRHAPRPGAGGGAAGHSGGDRRGGQRPGRRRAPLHLPLRGQPPLPVRLAPRGAGHRSRRDPGPLGPGARGAPGGGLLSVPRVPQRPGGAAGGGEPRRHPGGGGVPRLRGPAGPWCAPSSSRGGWELPRRTCAPSWSGWSAIRRPRPRISGWSRTRCSCTGRSGSPRGRPDSPEPAPSEVFVEEAWRDAAEAMQRAYRELGWVDAKVDLAGATEDVAPRARSTSASTSSRGSGPSSARCASRACRRGSPSGAAHARARASRSARPGWRRRSPTPPRRWGAAAISSPRSRRSRTISADRTAAEPMLHRGARVRRCGSGQVVVRGSVADRRGAGPGEPQAGPRPAAGSRGALREPARAAPARHVPDGVGAAHLPGHSRAGEGRGGRGPRALPALGEHRGGLLARGRAPDHRRPRLPQRLRPGHQLHPPRQAQLRRVERAAAPGATSTAPSSRA